MDFYDAALVLLGCFYAFAGFVAVRAGLTSWYLDKALAALSMNPVSSTEYLQTRWLLVAATMIHIGGVALIIRWNAAAALFVFSCVAQFAYVFVIAPRYFDRAVPADGKRRKQTVNAMVAYLAASLFVVWALIEGRLFAWRDLNFLSLLLAGAVLAAFAGYLIKALYFAEQSFEPSDDDDDAL